MKINAYALDWDRKSCQHRDSCDVDENFYLDNAGLLVSQCWLKVAIANIIFTFVLIILFRLGKPVQNWLTPLRIKKAAGFIMGSTTLSYVLCCTRWFIFGWKEDGIAFYFAALISFLGTKLVAEEYEASRFMNTICSTCGIVLFIVVNVAVLLVFLRYYIPFKLKVGEMDAKKSEEDMRHFSEHNKKKQAYSHYNTNEQTSHAHKEEKKDEDKTHEEQIPPKEDTPPQQKPSRKDPFEVRLELVEEMFKGFTDDPDKLKARYRELVKDYHPDQGGDQEMFKAVTSVYQKYKDRLR